MAILLFSVAISAQGKANSKNQFSSSIMSDSIHPGNDYFIPHIINSKLSGTKSLLEILTEQFKDLKIMSGEVYFTGAGFPYMERILFKGPGLEILKTYFVRCRAGSEITFVKCILKNTDGSISKPLNRTVMIK